MYLVVVSVVLAHDLDCLPGHSFLVHRHRRHHRRRHRLLAVVQYLPKDEMLMQVSVGNVVDFLHLNLVAVQRHPQNLMQEHLHLKINYIKKTKIYSFFIYLVVHQVEDSHYYYYYYYYCQPFI
jgi:hypothetical protein